MRNGIDKFAVYFIDEFKKVCKGNISCAGMGIHLVLRALSLSVLGLLELVVTELRQSDQE